MDIREELRKRDELLAGYLKQIFDYSNTLQHFVIIT